MQRQLEKRQGCHLFKARGKKWEKMAAPTANFAAVRNR